MFGDSQDAEVKERFKKFFEKFDRVLEGKTEITLVLDDPAGNSYIQVNLRTPFFTCIKLQLSNNIEKSEMWNFQSMKDDGPDDSLRVTHYERSHEQNEELGINDMVLENYEN